MEETLLCAIDLHRLDVPAKLSPCANGCQDDGGACVRHQGLGNPPTKGWSRRPVRGARRVNSVTSVAGSCVCAPFARNNLVSCSLVDEGLFPHG